jgi:hypothetical protein
MPGKNVAERLAGLSAIVATREDFQTIDYKQKKNDPPRIQTVHEAHLTGEDKQYVYLM